MLRPNLFSTECRRSPEFFTHGILPADFSPMLNLNADKFVLKQIYCKLLQTNVVKNIKVRRRIHGEPGSFHTAFRLSPVYRSVALRGDRKFRRRKIRRGKIRRRKFRRKENFTVRKFRRKEISS